MKTIKHRFVVFTIILMLCCSFLGAFSIVYASESNIEADLYHLSENSNVDTIHATTAGALPCIGEAKIVVFYVDFKGGASNWTKAKEEVESMFFSEIGKNDSSVAYSDADSLRSYYYRSSYGKVDISGSVFEYQTQNDSSYYNSLDVALDEIIEYYRDIINWDEYDGNNDGYIDGVYLIAKNEHSWGGPNFVGGYSNSVDNKKICKACFLASSSFSTMCHETCHMFGPADMYSGVSVNPSGIQTACIMENGCGDLPSATKFVLGWLDNVVFVNSDNIGLHKLRSYTNYGDVLIIYPNGDSTNRNWFFVEYVTNEGNNCQPGSSGIRVWKTQMYIDENYDIIGAKDFCSGMPSSPYEYLECIHPDDVWNYYMQVGQEISPYTYPSTAYSDTFYNHGGAKFLKDLTFSGINISFVNLEDEIATIDVHIEEYANVSKNENATLIPLSINQSSAFLDSKDLISFASLSSDIELKITTPITLTSKSSNDVYMLETKISKNNRNIQLCITPSILKSLKQHNDWTISNLGIVTYYGAKISISNVSETFDFSSYPTPLIDCDEQYSTTFNMSYEYDLKCFNVTNSTILSIYYNDITKKLYWGEINVENNTTKQYELLLPEDIVIDEWTNNESISIWRDYNAYFVHIGNYVCCYSNKTLISYFNLSDIDSSLIFKGTDDNSIFISNSYGKIYEMSFNNNSITFESIDIDISDIPLHLLDSIYCFIENQYIITTNNTVRFVDIEKDVVKEFFYEDNNDYGLTRTIVYYLDYNYYVFSSSKDLTMYKYDMEFKLLNETCMLKELSSTIWGPFKLNVSFINNSWLIYFESVSNSNAISYANTYMIICSESGKVINYYKYGDSSYRYVCQFVPISQYKFIGIKAFSFMYIRTECEQHIYNAPTYSWNDDQCTATRVCKRDANHVETETVTGVYVKDTDAACEANEKGHYEATFQNGAFAKQSTAKDSVEKPNSLLGHNFEWVIDQNATKTATGLKHEECTRCHATRNENTVIPILTCEHENAQKVNGKDATCTENGLKEYWHCPDCEKNFADSACKNEITGNLDTWRVIDKLGHSFTTYISDNNATCTADGTKTAHCDHAGCQETDTIADPGSKLGHSFTTYISNGNATCGEDGTKTAHCDRDGCNETDTVVDTGSKLGHDYGKPTYVWNGSQCTATRVCSHDPNHVETENAEVYYEKDTDATCTENEKGHLVAIFKNDVFTQQSTEKNSIEKPNSKLGHSFTTYVNDGNATCTEDGTKTAHCDHAGCQETDTIADVDSKLGHNYEWVIDQDATKTETGLKHEECTRCHATRNENTVIPILTCEHENAQKVNGKDATCTENGLKEYWHCPDCEKNFADSACKNEITGDLDAWRVIDKLGHSFTTYISDNNATCTADGTKTAHCDHAGCQETDTVADPGSKLGHSFTHYISDGNATCTEDGTKTAHCDHAGCRETDTVVDPGSKLGHAYGTPTYVWNGDQCTAKRVCSHDGSHIETETVKGIYVKDTDAACEANEKGHYEATFQNGAFAKQSTAKDSVEKLNSALGHNYEWVIDQDATKTETGLKHEECTHCHATRNENTIIPILTCEHENAQKVNGKDATCTENGLKEYWHCPDCEKNFADSACKNEITGDLDTWRVIDKLGHSFTTYISDNNATCTADGTKTAHCDHAGCDATDTIADVGSKLGHNYDKPTYKWNGDKCTATMVCLNDSEHAETETATAKYVKDTDATCTENEKGHYEVTFQNGAFEKQTTAKNSVEKLGTKLGHNYVAVVTPPTETERGYTTHTCSRCHHSYVDSYTDPVPAIKIGDVTGDNRIDAFDYQMLKAFVLGTYKDVTDKQKKSMDINHDNRIDAFDYQMLKAHVLGTYVIQ